MYHIDSGCFSHRRVKIMHISTISKDIIGEAITKILNHIWNNDTCTEIRYLIY